MRNINALLKQGEGLTIEFKKAKKHLPDKFFLEGMQRVSLRDKIFREIIANMLIHREYTNAFPSSFIT